MEKFISVVLFLSWAWAILWPIIGIVGGVAHWYAPQEKVIKHRFLFPNNYRATLITAILISKATALWILSLCLIYIL